MPLRGLDAELDEPLSARESPNDTSNEPDDPEVVVARRVHDVEDFWARTYPDLFGTPYEPISGGFFPYGPDTDVPPCGTPPPSYEQIAGNAFYCPEADLIGWDADALIPDLYEQFGPFTLGIVFAHEIGHAIQTARRHRRAHDPHRATGGLLRGAWTKDVAAGNSESFAVKEKDLDTSVAGFLELRDGIEVTQSDPFAHGSGFDRVGAFQDGFEEGASRCARYDEDDPPVVRRDRLHEPGGLRPWRQPAARPDPLRVGHRSGGLLARALR